VSLALRLRVELFPDRSTALTVTVTVDARRRMTLLTNLRDGPFSLSFRTTVRPAGPFLRIGRSPNDLNRLNLPFGLRTGTRIRPEARRLHHSLTQEARSTSSLALRCLTRTFSWSSGGLVSATVKLRVAGVGSTLLNGAWSIAATEKVCVPRPRPEYVRLPPSQA
jgi:hypothetical protein